MKIKKEQEFFAWPPLSKLNFYDGRNRLKFSTTDRLFDLSDGLMLNWYKKSRTIYLGISTKSKRWKQWEDAKLKEIEERIKYDLSFDGYYVSIKRLTENTGIACSKEFLWKLQIREP